MGLATEAQNKSTNGEDDASNNKLRRWMVEVKLSLVGLWFVVLSCAFEAASAVLTSRALTSCPFPAIVVSLELILGAVAALGLTGGVEWAIEGATLPAAFSLAVSALSSAIVVDSRGFAAPFVDVGAALRVAETTLADLCAAARALFGAPPRPTRLFDRAAPLVVVRRAKPSSLVAARWMGLEPIGVAVESSSFVGAAIAVACAALWLDDRRRFEFADDASALGFALCVAGCVAGAVGAKWTPAATTPTSLFWLSLAAGALLVPYAVLLHFPEVRDWWYDDRDKKKVNTPAILLTLLLAATAAHIKRQLRVKLHKFHANSPPAAAVFFAALRASSAVLALRAVDL